MESNKKQESPESAVNDLVWFMDCHKSNNSSVRKQTGGQISAVYLRQPNRPPRGIFVEKVRGHGSTANNQVDWYHCENFASKKNSEHDKCTAILK